MRIVAGTARGRRLAAPAGEGTRPTSDKVRGAIFNVLGQFFDGRPRPRPLRRDRGPGDRGALPGLRRRDLRGLVARGRGGHRPERRGCGFAGRVTVLRRRVADALPALPAAAFDLAFVDPPYAEGPGAALAALDRVLRPGAVVVAEHDRRSPRPIGSGRWSLEDRRAYGDTGISIYRRD